VQRYRSAVAAAIQMLRIVTPGLVPCLHLLKTRAEEKWAVGSGKRQQPVLANMSGQPQKLQETP